jgi:hypothetical protein
VRFKVFTSVMILTVFHWVKLPYRLVGKSRRFGEACCLHVARNDVQVWRWGQHASPKRRLLPTIPHGELHRKITSGYSHFVPAEKIILKMKMAAAEGMQLNPNDRLSSDSRSRAANKDPIFPHVHVSVRRKISYWIRASSNPTTFVLPLNHTVPKYDTIF